jgi:hypothetical protein
LTFDPQPSRNALEGRRHDDPGGSCWKVARRSRATFATTVGCRLGDSRIVIEEGDSDEPRRAGLLTRCAEGGRAAAPPPIGS